VLISAQICFIARPKTPAKKILATNDPVREASAKEKAFFTIVVATAYDYIRSIYLSLKVVVGFVH
jgi:hypothetical protein